MCRFGIVTAALVCTLSLGASSAFAAGSANHKKKPTSHRVGGKVHHAWPKSGKRPKTALARWLARQIGPTEVQPCRKKVHGKVVKCHRKKSPRNGAPLPAAQLGGSKGHQISAAAAFMKLGQDVNPIAYAATTSSPATTSTGSTDLKLARSYAIPTDDPSYTRLLNWSWTYDSAMTAAALTTAGAPSVAEELLDQLAALQHTDGSIEIAFNDSDGTTESQFRTGTIASVGLAGSIYDQDEHTDRYRAMEQRAASYLLSLQGTNGLIRGGPDVIWDSTQHNLLAYAFLVNLGNELTAANLRTTATPYYAAATKIATAIEANLIVHSGTTAYFIEGLGDSAQSVDADALGVLYLVSRGETTLAQQVLTYAQGAFALSGRSITKSTVAASYNNTYAAPGPFSGFKPFLGTGAPDVLWTEGSAEMELADFGLGQSVPAAALNTSLLAIYALSPTFAPVMADRTVTNVTYSSEFHVWPSTAAGAWFLLTQSKPTLFARIPS
jgi:hypothetical protein